MVDYSWLRMMLGAGMKYERLLMRIAILLGSLYTGLALAADDQSRSYWVVGSYTNQATAMAEGEKISQETGLEIVYTVSVVAQKTHYRLLVPQFDEAEDQSRLMRQLDLAGIDEPWLLKLDETSTRSLSMPDREEKRLYLVLGSFKNHLDADLLVSSIMETFNQIAEVHQFTVHDEDVVRVMIGPYTEMAEIDAERELFVQKAYPDAWIIALSPQDQEPMYDDESYAGVESMDRSALRPDREQMVREATEESDRTPENTINSGYNLARLRKKPVH